MTVRVSGCSTPHGFAKRQRHGVAARRLEECLRPGAGGAGPAATVLCLDHAGAADECSAIAGHVRPVDGSPQRRGSRSRPHHASGDTEFRGGAFRQRQSTQSDGGSRHCAPRNGHKRHVSRLHQRRESGCRHLTFEFFCAHLTTGGFSDRSPDPLRLRPLSGRTGSEANQSIRCTFPAGRFGDSGSDRSMELLRIRRRHRQWRADHGICRSSFPRLG